MLIKRKSLRKLKRLLSPNKNWLKTYKNAEHKLINQENYLDL